MRVFASNTPDAETVGSVAAGSTLGLEQALLANAGQVGLNVLAVGYTNTGKVQGVSLGAGNVVEVYASGADFSAGTVLYREFMSFGEPIAFTGLSSGAIITSTQGFYGVSEVSFGGTLVATMPLLSLGLGVTDTFMFSFRESERTTQNHAFLFVVNGPLESTLEVFFGDGSSISDQPAETLSPWQFTTVHLDGNTEYRITATNPVMVCTACGFNNSDYTSSSNPISAGPRDARLVLPLTNDGITHPRSGFLSALYDDTVVDWYDVAGDEGTLNDGVGISPGSPEDIDAGTPQGTGNSTTDYRPDGFTRFKAIGLVSAYSGADGAGGDASPMCPISAMSQVVAQPFYIDDSGNGDQTSVTIASPYVGTAKVYEWNDTTSQLDLAYTVPLNRQGVTVTTQDDQNHPTAGQVSNEPDTGVVTLVGDLDAGVVVADVPIMVISQSNLTNAVTLRSQNGTTTSSVDQQDDETLLFGITPQSIAAEIREDADGVLRKRTIDNTGAETWEVA